MATGVSGAEPPAPSPSGFVARYLCICPSFCPKPLPGICWDYKMECDNYCAKPLPCLKYPCLKWECDNYDCKPEPFCYPKPLCPAPIRCAK